MTKDKTKPAKTGRKLDGTFAKGHSGNKAGRGAGSRNKATLLAQSLFDGQAEELVQAAITKALEGDQQMLRLCVERLVPARKDTPIKFRMPTIKEPEDIVTAINTVASAVAAGKLSPAEGEIVGKILDRYVKAIEVYEVLKRLEKLEEEIK